MWLVWSVSALCIGVAVACVSLFLEDWRNAERGWQLLAASGIPLSLAGLGFIIRFWKPHSGPFTANELYPLGPYVNAWAVSFGFMWLAFGVAFLVLSLRGGRDIRIWWALLTIWFLAWLPHGIIGVGFLVAGQTELSMQLYRDWASRWPDVLGLVVGGSALLIHIGLSVSGFAVAGRALMRRSG